MLTSQHHVTISILGKTVGRHLTLTLLTRTLTSAVICYFSENTASSGSRCRRTSAGKTTRYTDFCRVPMQKKRKICYPSIAEPAVTKPVVTNHPTVTDDPTVTDTTVSVTEPVVTDYPAVTNDPTVMQTTVTKEANKGMENRYFTV